MSVYIELISRMAERGDLIGVIKLSTWVAENEGKNEPLAKQLIEIAEKQTTAAPSQVKALFELVERLSQTKKSNQKAIKMIKELTPQGVASTESRKEIFPNTMENHLSYARFFISIDKPNDAEYHFLRAIALSGESNEAYIEYAQFLENTDRVLEAKNQYLEALNKDPSDPTVHNNLGILYYQEGRFDKAANHFKESLVIEPDSTTMNNLANIFADMGNTVDAENLFKPVSYTHLTLPTN